LQPLEVVFSTELIFIVRENGTTCTRYSILFLLREKQHVMVAIARRRNKALLIAAYRCGVQSFT